MNKVYVAGAYTDDTVIGILRNIGRGQAWASLVFRSGMAPFCPWFDKEFVINQYIADYDVKDFYEYSLAWLRASDAVFIVPNEKGLRDWQDSKGTLAEIKEAERLGIPVFYSFEGLLEWNKNNQS